MSPQSQSPSSAVADSGDCWQLQEAKARFSEVVRRASEKGPQHVSVNGRERAVILSAAEYVRLRGRPTGKLLVELMGDSPLTDVIMEHPKTSGPVRDVEL